MPLFIPITRYIDGLAFFDKKILLFSLKRLSAKKHTLLKTTLIPQSPTRAPAYPQSRGIVMP